MIIRSLSAACVVLICVGTADAAHQCALDCSPMLLQREPITPAPSIEPHVGDVDSVAVTAFIMTREAHQVDTMRAIVNPLPRLSARAVVETGTLPCGPWNAFSRQAGAEILVVKGDPSSIMLDITRAREGPAPPATASQRCGPQEPPLSEFAAFLLGDVGDTATEPVTLCFFAGRACSSRYVLDPARHTLAQRAHIMFRIADLRPEARTDEQLAMRLRVQPAPDDLIPFLVISAPAWLTPSAYMLRRVARDEWEYAVRHIGGLPHDAELRVYLMAR